MKTYQPLVSIIIPLYNRRRYIEECIDSIFAQTCQDFEVFVVDDGSTDGGAELCEEKYGGDARFHLVRQKNEGAWAARNHGIDLAHGRYVTFLDNDDFLGAQNGLQYMADLADQTQADVTASMGCYDLLDGDNHLHPRFDDPAHKEHPYVLSDTMEGRMAWYDQYASAAIWNKFFRRDFLERYHIRFPKTRYHEDCLFVIPCLFRAKTYVCTPFLYYVYRISHGSILRAPKTLDDMEEIVQTMPRILQSVDDFLGDMPYFKQHPASLRLVKERQLDELLKMPRQWGFYPTPTEHVDAMKDAVQEAFASIELSTKEMTLLLAYLFTRYNEDCAILEKESGSRE